MSRDPRYQKLLNSKRWQVVKAIVWKRANGCCEMCMKEGIVTGSLTKQLDCHHIRPVEGAHTVEGPDGMKARCYDPNNIMLVCQDCHIKIHTEAKSHTKEKVAENKARARRRFMEANDPNFVPDEPTPYGEKADAYLRDLEERAKAKDFTST